MDESTYRLNGVTREAVESEIDAIWTALQKDPTLRERARESGIDVSVVDGIDRASALKIEKTGSGFAGAELLIVFGVMVAKDVWKSIILPRLKQRFGADAVVPK